jgi:uncharacterized protein (TIGR02246 family)
VDASGGLNVGAVTTREELDRQVLAFTDAFNRDDLEAVMDTFADDAIYDEFNGVRHEGKAAIRAAFEPQFSGKYGVIRFLEEDRFLDVASGKAMISWTCTLETDDGPVGWRGLDLLHFEDGKLTQKHTYAKAKTLQIEPR